ncbi:MAG TPA: hypothetical protein GXX31_02970 [Methanothermobacter sp.]|jgi:hypothetical protein|uniref:AAA family ATPase n=1 Tax=Methanothermobacter tenebrarum TaxID=680118 RepID=A0ABN6PCQ3_9EURY|nr:hypothetical protein [Methanothermobacter tenebrarum]MDI6882598.1 hypothetical protein [Methanothermobacter sp.]MDX9693868.1 hypothetical protein [Methanothermobacter sp.]BDH78654.1 hypothetical protein MTTB_00330 [Methanothermobacter tenebrarum]HHW16330.1 hypothetical protein [Methanothermobacter sp.]HOQ20383.1 hypothetical protein [Methanothermobacter sp.]
MTRQNKSLGRGLDALIKAKSTTTPQDEPTTPPTHPKDKVKEVLDEVKKNPRITLWSARSAAVLRYLKKTKPEFSISKEASLLIEEAVKNKYPQIWDLFSELE